MKDRLFFGKTFCAVEFSFDAEGNEVYYSLQLLKKQKELEIKKSEQFTDLVALCKELKKDNQDHIVLVVNNKQVLSKNLDKLNDEKKVLFKRAYPSLSLNDFYVQITELLNHISISVIRESYIIELTKSFSNHQIEVLDIYLGNASFSSLANIVQESQVYTSNAKLKITEEKVESIESKSFESENYLINGLQINSKYILSLNAIVNFYLIKNVAYENSKLNDFKNRKIFNLGYKTVLGIIFMLVLANFMFFNNYNTKVNNLSQQLEVKKGVKLKLKKLKANVKKKQKLLAELQNSSSFSVSKYADQVVAEMPSSIILSDIIYQPLSRPLKKDKETNFKTKEIEIKGLLSDYVEFTEWIDGIEKKSWVKELSQLTTEKEKKKKNSNFHILIRVK
ncbi:hypothetical protein [uncultured Tenacibaculum sp.]|uniref:hypothetical protein n=1 Tax=uncultured Tenacibaculum sp. TaxID=174713 RepID=UPI00261D5614|nr:hypothetical protein [uncultured Tenacibaculum sp.]